MRSHCYFFPTSIAHDLSSVASKFGRGKMAENNNLGMGWDWVEDVCFPLFHCVFEMYVIPKPLLKFQICYFTSLFGF